jgi:hypothetical protein
MLQVEGPDEGITVGGQDFGAGHMPFLGAQSMTASLAFPTMMGAAYDQYACIGTRHGAGDRAHATEEGWMKDDSV